MGSSNKTTQTTTSPIPQWMSDNGKAISTTALGMPTTYTQSNRNAPVQPGYGTVQTQIENARTGYQPYQSRADTAMTGAFNDNKAQTINAPEFTQENVAKFQNPYDQSVIDATIKDMERSRQIAMRNGGSNAAAAGAFGGARHGVADAETNRAYDDNTFRTVAGLRSAGYDKAVGQYNQDFSQKLAALQNNNAAAGQNFNQGQTYGTNISNLGQQGVQNEANAAQANFSLTNQLQGIAQGGVDKTAEENRYAQNYALDALAKQAAINSGSPYERTSTSTTTQPSNMLGTALYAAGSAAPLLMSSDERIKENIEDLNPEGVLGAFAKIPTKSYDYKPEHAGPYKGRRDGFMAQDYETAFGEQSPEVGGVKHIDIPQLAGRVVAAIKGLEERTRHLKRSA